MNVGVRARIRAIGFGLRLGMLLGLPLCYVVLRNVTYCYVMQQTIPMLRKIA